MPRNVVRPARSAGGHRRYSRRQLEFADAAAALSTGLTLGRAHRMPAWRRGDSARERFSALEQARDQPS